MTLTTGTPAVAFELPSTNGLIRLSQYRGRSVLLSFFSMAFTPV